MDHRLTLLACAALLGIHPACTTEQHRQQIAQAVLLYLPFDGELAFRGSGSMGSASPARVKETPGARFDTQGIHGSALHLEKTPLGPLPVTLGSRARSSGQGWSGTLSFWLRLSPSESASCRLLEVRPRGSVGGFVIEFLQTRPPVLVVQAQCCAAKTGSANSADLRVEPTRLQPDRWHQLSLAWANLDHRSHDAWLAVYLDGKLQATWKQRPLALQCAWEQLDLYFGQGCQATLDEFALFDRPLSIAEIRTLWREPGLLASRVP